MPATANSGLCTPHLARIGQIAGTGVGRRFREWVGLVLGRPARHGDRLATACSDLAVVRPWALAAVLALSGAGLLLAPSEPPKLEGPPRQLGANTWQLTWRSEMGAHYRLERSYDLKTWTAVDTLTASGPTSSLLDDGVAGRDKVFWRIALIEDDPAAAALRLTNVSRNPADPNQWRLTWTSEAGVVYRLERSFDLQRWEVVGSVTGLPDFTTMIDAGIPPGQSMAFWRVVVEGGGGGTSLVVGDLALEGLAVNGPDSSVNLQLLVGGTESVSEVLLFDGETPLGPARRSFGGVWSFTLDWEAGAPRIYELAAEVHTTEGTVLRSAVRRLLLADPAHFVPLTADGHPLYGGCVPVDDAGALGAFLYQPEPPADSGRGTGAHFEFAAGATVVPPSPPAGVRIVFSQGIFHRGPAGASPPVAVVGAGRSLDLGQLTPAEVARAFGLAPGPVDLDWGSVSVAWESGSLGPGGWAKLQVRPPLGDLALPQGRGNACVGEDPATGERFLIVCHHGVWVPIPGGPVFAIPQADPLKIYLRENGGLAAHGTAEASFPNGAVVRGSLAWRHPNFEFRFEGKGIVIPALDTLRRLLPTEPLAAMPTGESAAELDEFAALLEGYRDAMRGVALGGAGQGDTVAPASPQPLPSPADEAGTALQAWAGRIASWAGDRGGQTLGENETEELTRVVRQAGRTAEGAHDLPTVLKLLEHTLVVSRNLAPALGAGPGADALQAILAGAEIRIFAAAERLIGGNPESRDRHGLSEVVVLLERLKPLAILPVAAAPLPNGPPPAETSEARFRRMVAAFRNGMNVRDVFRGEYNTLSADELIGALQMLVAVLRQLRADDTATSPADAPPEFPIAATNQLVNTAFITRHDADADRVLMGGRIGELRALLATRASFFAFNAQLGNLFPSSSLFRATTGDLVARYVRDFQELPISGKPVTCRSDWSWVELLRTHTSDNGADSDISFALTAMNQCSDLVAAALSQAAGANRCDELLRTFQAQPGFYFEPFRACRDCRDMGPNREREGDAFMDLTGRYEAKLGSEGSGTWLKETYAMMQLNQCGRYFEGQLQIQEVRGGVRTTSYLRSKVEGLFLAKSLFDPGSAYGEAAFRLRETGGEGNTTTRYARGTAVRTFADTDSIDQLVLQITGWDQPLVFRRISPQPTLSNTLLDAFGTTGGAAVASQNSPLHQDLFTQLLEHAGFLNRYLENYFGPAVENDSSAEREQLEKIKRTLSAIRVLLAPEQEPLIGPSLNWFLSCQRWLTVPAKRITRRPSDIGPVSRSRWDLLLAVAVHHNLTDLLDLVSTTADQVTALMGTETITYQVSILGTGMGGGAALISVGAWDYEVLVEKDKGALPHSFPLRGGIGSWSPSLGAPVFCSQLETTVTFASPYDFSPTDFEGPAGLIQVGASNTAIPDKLRDIFKPCIDGWNNLVEEKYRIPEGADSWAIGVLVIFGSARFPALPVSVSGFSHNECSQISAGLDVGVGWLEALGDPPPPGQSMVFQPGERRQFDLSAHPNLEGGVFFETDGFTLSPGGVQFLREFVAENRALFIGEQSKIEVNGYTDTIGAMDFNLALSQSRANAVRCVLRDLLGSALRVPVDAVGFGEGPAAAALGQVPDQDPQGVDDPLFLRADVVVGGHIVASLKTR